MSLRSVRPLVLAAALGGVPVSAAPEAAPAGDALRLVHTYSGWRDAASFKRISEYFSGRENTGGEIVVRTHPESRGGYYFLVRADNPGPPVAVRIVLEVITPDSTVPRTFTFAASLPAGKDAVLDLGLTGADWPDAKVHAVAWHLEFLDSAGHRLAADKSYLWDKPAGP